MTRLPLRRSGVRFLVLALLATALSIASPAPAPAAAIGAGISPSLTIRVLADGLTLPWDLAQTPDGAILFTERPGRLKVRMPNGTVRTVAADLGDLFARGETGLLGLALHPNFAENRRFYTCQGHTGPQIQVIGWTINAGYTQATRINDPLVAGIPLVTGRHGGCRVRFGPHGNLWIATGDAAQSSAPQSRTSLGGKVLRVDPNTGQGVAGNPFFTSTNANTRRIYSFGHRNLQGLSQRPGTNEMWTVEHGPDRDDEINRITAGGNYGWDPGPGYNENVPMTDLNAFPNAIEAQWDTGSPTLAMAGGFWVRGTNWGPLDNTLAVASLKNRSLRFFDFDDNGEFLATELGDELSGTHGRLRTPMMSTNGTLLVTTSNGSNDKILEVIPTGAPRGVLDKVRVIRNNKVRVRGWAIDPNRLTPAAVQVTIDGQVVKQRRASRLRPDVGRAFGDYGPNHGFVIRVTVPDGEHEICVRAIDAGRFKVAPVTLGCRTVTMT